MSSEQSQIEARLMETLQNAKADYESTKQQFELAMQVTGDGLELSNGHPRLNGKPLFWALPQGSDGSEGSASERRGKGDAPAGEATREEDALTIPLVNGWDPPVLYFLPAASNRCQSKSVPTKDSAAWGG